MQKIVAQPANACGFMVVHLISANRLKNKDWIGLQNPFVVFDLGPLGEQKQQSRTIKDGGRDPLFDQRFFFTLDGKETTFNVQCFHKGGLSNSSIGKTALLLEQLISSNAQPLWYTLEGNRGELQLRTWFRGTFRGSSIDNFDADTIPMPASFQQQQQQPQQQGGQMQPQLAPISSSPQLQQPQSSSSSVPELIGGMSGLSIQPQQQQQQQLPMQQQQQSAPASTWSGSCDSCGYTGSSSQHACSAAAGSQGISQRMPSFDRTASAPAGVAVPPVQRVYVRQLTADEVNQGRFNEPEAFYVSPGQQSNFPFSMMPQSQQQQQQPQHQQQQQLQPQLQQQAMPQSSLGAGPGWDAAQQPTMAMQKPTDQFASLGQSSAMGSSGKSFESSGADMSGIASKEASAEQARWPGFQGSSAMGVQGSSSMAAQDASFHQGSLVDK